MITRLVRVLLICFTTFSCSSENLEAYLSGTVYDDTSNSGLSDVLVEVTSSDLTNEVITTARTDSSGVYSIGSALEAGRQYTVRFSLPGYEPVSITQTLSVGPNRQDTQLKLSPCSLHVAPSVIDLAGSDTSSSTFTITNIGSRSCEYALALSNNGPSGSRPLISVTPSSDMGGVLEQGAKKQVQFIIERQNFNNNIASNQTVNILENGANFSISVRVYRDLGCFGCSRTNLYGGQCPQDITCSGCCLQRECIKAGRFSGEVCPLNGIGQTCSSCVPSSLSCQQTQSQQYQCSCSEPSIREAPVLDQECQTLDIQRPCRQTVRLGCGQGSANECVACGSCQDNIQNQGETGIDCGGLCDACVPSTVTLNLTPTPIRMLQFSWNISRNATFYRLLESDSDSFEDYEIIEDNIPADQLEYPLTASLFEIKDRYYKLQSCDLNICVDSNTVQASDLVAAIGYIKADNSGSSDQLGYDVSLSGDGRTMVVGAPFEDAPITSINPRGNQSDDLTQSGAVYVFSKVAGSWIQEAYIKASNADTYDSFGFSVAISADGNTIAVGAIGEDSSFGGINAGLDNNDFPSSGAVYVFAKNANGEWIQQVYLKAPNVDQYDQFGRAVALSSDGNTLAVGAPGEQSTTTTIEGDREDNTGISVGAVYIFSRSGGYSWIHQSYIKPSVAGSGFLPALRFGNAVSLMGTGNILAVGCEGDDELESESGAVYVFVRTNNLSWSQEARIKASNPGDSDLFGSDVALSGDGQKLIVAAKGEAGDIAGINVLETDDSAPNTGAVYIYRRDPTNVRVYWVKEAYIKPPELEYELAPGFFGSSVATNLNGDTVAIGMDAQDSLANGINGDVANSLSLGSGAAYMIKFENEQWQYGAFIKSIQTTVGDKFGASLALSADGQTLAVGAPLEDSQATTIQGDPNDESKDSSGAVFIY